MKYRVNEAVGREITRSDDTDPWDRAIELLLGPRMPSEPPERRRDSALALAAAAIKAAEEIDTRKSK